MPRIAGQSVPKYRRHRASGQAICTVNGQDFYLGEYRTRASKIEYDRLIAEWLVNGRQSPGASDENLTVNELIVHYWRFVKSHYVKAGKPTSEQASIKVAVRPVRELYGTVPAREFGPLALKAVRLKQIDSGLSRGSVNQNMGRIKRLFKWAVSEQLVPAETFQALATVVGLRAGRSAARETQPILPVADIVVEKTLEHLPQVVGDMIRIQRLTGMRPSEVCQMRSGDIDRSGPIWVFVPKGHKTEHHGRKRSVYVGPIAQKVLRGYLDRDDEDYLFRPVDSEKKRRADATAARKTPANEGNVVGSNRLRRPKKKPGLRYDASSYGRCIRSACDRAFLHPVLSAKKKSELTKNELVALKAWQSKNRWSPNRLRHACATEIRREFGIEHAQIILGHASPDTTLIYAEADAQKGLEVAAKIG